MTMEWPQLQHSKSAVRRAAQALVENDMSLEEKQACIATVADFRSAHVFPMQSMVAYFRGKALEVDARAIVVRRLKRIPSIIAKLKRFPTMQVTTMGDIGGIRIITRSMRNVRDIRNGLVRGRSNNTMLSEKDYMSEPKDSGYRGIHLLYSYGGSKTEYRGFRVELQIRSQIQHAWATAVEVAGAFLGENLKASLGDAEWLEFFRLVSRAFACVEDGRAVDGGLREAIGLRASALNAVDKLRSFSVFVRYSDVKAGFYLLQLNIAKGAVSARYFTENFVDEAYEEYRRIEQEISEDTTQDVVLVSARSALELKKAYPNYFADTYLFMKNLERVMNSG